MFPADSRGTEAGIAIQRCQVLTTVIQSAIERASRWLRERRRNDRAAMIAAIRAAAWDE